MKDMDEEPACYDLQQFMIDQHFQNKGYGTEALGLILSALSKERKYGLCIFARKPDRMKNLWDLQDRSETQR